MTKILTGRIGGFAVQSNWIIGGSQNVGLFKVK